MTPEQGLRQLNNGLPARYTAVFTTSKITQEAVRTWIEIRNFKSPNVRYLCPVEPWDPGRIPTIRCILEQEFDRKTDFRPDTSILCGVQEMDEPLFHAIVNAPDRSNDIHTAMITQEDMEELKKKGNGR